MQSQAQEDLISPCPSFDTFSSPATAAARVLAEDDSPELPSHRQATDDNDFEFKPASNHQDPESLLNRPIFPVFNRHLHPTAPEDTHISLQNLFTDADDDESSTSSSSSENELEAVAPETYCVWTPRPPAGRCVKSSSTGSSSRSGRWSFIDLLLKRSNSERSSVAAKKSEERVNKGFKKGGTTLIALNSHVDITAKKTHERLYVRNRKRSEEERRRRTYLPYRTDLLGFFANVNALGRTFPPFS